MAAVMERAGQDGDLTGAWPRGIRTAGGTVPPRVHPLATRTTKGAWYRQWRLMSIDGATLDLADTEANVAELVGRGIAAVNSRRIHSFDWSAWPTGPRQGRGLRRVGAVTRR